MISYDSDKEHEDIMSAEDIIKKLQLLAEEERAENEPKAEEDAKLLDEAIAAVQQFISAEEDENDQSEDSGTEAKHVVDTGLLTGPIGGLKNFLIKKQRDNEAQ